jgi:hypothetical protein
VRLFPAIHMNFTHARHGPPAIHVIASRIHTAR